jgi:hypothetical protein
MGYEYQNWFTIGIIVGLVVSTIISGFNRLAGGIIGFIVTTFILAVGLDIYRSPGWRLTYFGFEISRDVFLILIAVWYFFDIIAIIRGLRKRRKRRVID